MFGGGFNNARESPKGISPQNRGGIQANCRSLLLKSTRPDSLGATIDGGNTTVRSTSTTTCKT